VRIPGAVRRRHFVLKSFHPEQITKPPTLASQPPTTRVGTGWLQDNTRFAYLPTHGLSLCVMSDDRKRQKTEQRAAGFSTEQPNVEEYWKTVMQEVNAAGGDLAEFKTAQLPLARIKKIMKSDEDVRMISSEAPVLFAKACEYFINELTMRSWHMAENNKRKTLTKADVAAAVAATEVWDFLADTVPVVEHGEWGGEVATAGGQGAAGAVGAVGAVGAAAYQVGVVPVYAAAGGVPSQYAEEEEEEE